MWPEDKIYLLIKEEVVDSDGYYEVTKKDVIGAFTTREAASKSLITNEDIDKKVNENKYRERGYSCGKAYDHKSVTKHIDYNGSETVIEIYWDPDREYWTRWWIEEMNLQGKEEKNACAGTSDHE